MQTQTVVADVATHDISQKHAERNSTICEQAGASYFDFNTSLWDGLLQPIMLVLHIT